GLVAERVDVEHVPLALIHLENRGHVVEELGARLGCVPALELGVGPLRHEQRLRHLRLRQSARAPTPADALGPAEFDRVYLSPLPLQQLLQGLLLIQLSTLPRGAIPVPVTRYTGS